MELSREEAPLYGQVTAWAVLQDLVPEHAEFYVVLVGCRLSHVTVGNRTEDGLSLSFTVPGHDLPEVVSVTAYQHTEGGTSPCGVGASLTYISDTAQEVAEYLVANGNHLSPQSYLEVLKRYSTGEGGTDLSSSPDQKQGLEQCNRKKGGGLRGLDKRITQAMANMDASQQWRDAGSQQRDVPDLQPRETLLHLSVRLGLLHLSSFLIRQPRGQRLLTLPNQEGSSPLQLAQKGGEHSFFRALAMPLAVPPVGMRPVWLDGSCVLRFCPLTESLSLTVQPDPEHCVQKAIMLLRERLRDPAILKQITLLKEELQVDTSDKEDALTSEDGDFSLELHAEYPALVDNEEDEEEEEECSAVKSLPLSVLSSGPRRSGDERDTMDPFTDLTCKRTHSGDPTPAKVMSDQGVRLRSYSYSTPKVNLRGPRFARDPTSTPATDINPDGGFSSSVGHSRSLLQALSLSKSLSLLHPGKQRASSVSEQTQDKREVKFRKRAQSADDEGSVELAESLQHLTLSEFLKEIEEEEWDKYSIPSKAETEKYKVIRTFSFLKSRMSSTRNKNKGKGKDREAKERPLNGHLFSTGACVGPSMCLVCDKPASGKDLLHCSCCTLMVHKGCRESAPPCLKKLQDKYAVTMVKSRTASLPQNFTVRDGPTTCFVPVSASLPIMTPKDKRDPALLLNPLSRSVSSATDRCSETAESENWRVSGQGEELSQTNESSTSTDSSLGEDCVDSCLHGDLAADDQDYEAESWSLMVEHKFLAQQDKQVVKRQDVIYELMQTEMHHLQTLHIMAEVFRRGMRLEVQLEAHVVARVFPCLDELLLLHHTFFGAMQERRHTSSQAHGHGNYLIQRIGDILLQQFSDESAERMKQVYGEFCSHHNEAVSFFKELQQQNKRFQNFIKQQSNNSLVRRREIPECILLVTQRITKYPVLLERILQYTQENTEEHADLSKALLRVREVIAAVDLWVSKYEQDQRLQEVLSRMENRSSAKLKSGHTFRKQDMVGRTLKHQGPLLWKTATGRLKDVLGLLLTDSLIFLQEKDQKYMFAAVDQKPPVISLQKLIVRGVANEERGMFLISASAAGPEMYEVHTFSKEERNTWMRLIREAVESCPEEEDATSGSEEERRAAEARVQKIHRLQESLSSQDQQICSNLEEKLLIYGELSALSGLLKEPRPQARLLVQPHPEEVPQAAVLLTAALREAENLRATLSSSKACSPSSPVQALQIDPPLPEAQWEPPADPESSPGETESREAAWTASEALALQYLHPLQTGEADNINLKVAQSVQSLTQLLFSLQAAVAIQDSLYEVQRLLLHENEHPSPHGPRPHLPCPRGNALQEQEKQRNLEKRREEVAAALRLQGRLRQERQRWERECQARQLHQVELEGRLEERERHCHLEAERLRGEREALDRQQEEYQQSLERLREGQRSVERERQRLETQQRLLQSWRHSRQRSLPSVMGMVIPLDGQQDTVPSSRLGDGSVFVNEAAFTSNNRRLHHQHHHHQRRDDPSTHNSLNALLARSTHRQAKTPTLPTDPQGWLGETGCLYTSLEGLEPQHSPNDINTHSLVREAWSSTATGVGRYLGLPHPSDPQLDMVTLETESGEEGGEEKIVYL
ncbi:rho guanine nucleotide exchange factor 28 [Aplochiton taeniatus]